MPVVVSPAPARGVARPFSSARTRARAIACHRARGRATRCRAAEAVSDDEYVTEDPEIDPAEAAATAEEKLQDIPLPTYTLNCLYLDKCIGIAVDQTLASGERGPVTEYFMWPENDAWTQLKESLEQMPWVTSNDTINLLNTSTAVINYWQDSEPRRTIDEAREEFPQILFFGA